MLTRWIIWTNLLMAASAAGWVIVTINVLDLPFDWLLIALAFFLALSFYIRDRLDQKEQRADQISMPERTAWIRRHAKLLRLMTWVGFAGAIVIVAMRPVSAIPLLAGLGFALTYTVRWLPWRGQRVGWKHLPALKMPFVAILWAITTVMGPATVYGQVWHGKTWRLAAAVCLLIMVQILLNDLRDLAGDRVGGTQSLPVMIGDQASRWVGLVMAVASIAVIWPHAVLVFSLTAVYSLLLIWRYEREHDARWRAWIEGQGIVAAVVSIL